MAGTRGRDGDPTRQLELERLTGWMTRLQSAGVRAIPTGVPSLAGLIAICDRALNGVGERPASREARQAIERCAARTPRS